MEPSFEIFWLEMIRTNGRGFWRFEHAFSLNEINPNFSSPFRFRPFISEIRYSVKAYTVLETRFHRTVGGNTTKNHLLILLFIFTLKRNKCKATTQAIYTSTLRDVTKYTRPNPILVKTSLGSNPTDLAVSPVLNRHKKSRFMPNLFSFSQNC